MYILVGETEGQWLIQKCHLDYLRSLGMVNLGIGNPPLDMLCDRVQLGET